MTADANDRHGATDTQELADDAVVDPHFLDLMAGGTSSLPASYMPSAPPGQVNGWRRGAVWVLLGGLMVTMATGLCITYGPEQLLLLLR